MGARIWLCGRLEAELDGERIERRLPGRQGPLVLALLVMNRERPVARDELINALWPGAPPADPDESLSALLSKVRQAVGKDRLTGRRELTLVLPDDAEVDVEQALAAADQAQSALTAGDWAAAWDAAGTAAEITGRGFLVGFDSPWVEEQRGQLEEVRLRALEARAQAGVPLGGANLAGAERAARELVRAAPLREAGHRLLMEALAARGEVAEALTAYEAMRVLLRDELGTTPGEAARALHERLLAGEPAHPPAPQAPAAPAARAPKPVPLPALLSRERGDFVGRERELEQLRTAWDEARVGRRRLMLLRGGPGIGKTRLAGELARAAQADGMVLYAGCQEDGLVSYQPFVDALRHYLRNVPLDDAPERVGPGAAELARLIPELAQPVPAAGQQEPDDPETRRYLMFDAVSSLLNDACERAPVLLILDDLHWADRSTLKLLRHVVRAQDEAALLIVGSYREADVADDHPLLELLADLRRDGLFERVSLTGLDRGSVGSLIESHAGQAAPSALIGTVHAETEGNPFFVGEVVRHLIESGAMFEQDGRVEVGVPEGVKEVVARRLARLSETCRGVLSHAAVLGREFPFELLPPMSGLDEETVIGAIEEALGARLIEEGQGSEHAFTHALVRETLHDALSSPRRRRMHAQAAQAIEAAGSADEDTLVATLAVHYRLAGPAADAGKAIEYSLRAGERARQLFAWDEARAHWDGALAPMERTGAAPADRARLMVGLAEICAVAGDLGGQIAYLERALRLYTEGGDEGRTAQVHSRLGFAHSANDSLDRAHLDIGRAFDHFDAARPVLERAPGRRALGHLEIGVGGAWTYALSVQPGMEAGARGMEIGEQIGDDALWAGAAVDYAWHTIVAGDLREGFDTVERSFEVSDRGRRPFLAWMASQTRGQLTWGLGDPDGAQPFFERALALPYAGETAYRQQLADAIGRCHASRGEMDEARALLSDATPAWLTHALQPLVDLWDGEWDRVEALAGRVLETSRRTANRWDEWAAEHLAARVMRLRGEHEQAVAPLERAREIVTGGGARYFELWVLPDLARVLGCRGRVEEARTHVDKCREIVAGGEDWRGRLGAVEVAEAAVLSFEGRADEASARFESALATLRRYKLVADEADCLHDWSLALARAGDSAGAAERSAAAAEIYRRHRAGAVWLERVGAAAASSR